MSVRVEVVLVCDVRRSRGCHGQYAKVLGPWVLPGAEERVRLEAPSTGWTREEEDKDACPACAAARLAGIVGPHDREEIETLPANPAVWRR